MCNGNVYLFKNLLRGVGGYSYSLVTDILEGKDIISTLHTHYRLIHEGFPTLRIRDDEMVFGLTGADRRETISYEAIENPRYEDLRYSLYSSRSSKKSKKFKQFKARSDFLWEVTGSIY